MNIVVDDVHFTYATGGVALQGVTLQITAGERVAIIGRNGSGKSTLARHFNGLLRPTRGVVTIGDWTTHTHSVAQLARRVGYVFQNPDEQICKHRVWDEVAFGAVNLGVRGAQLRERVEWALARLALAEHAHVNPYDLSPSWRRRVAIAAVLAMATPILVLDEPTTGQDAQFVAHFAGLLDELQTLGKTVVVISHDVDFVAEHFPRVIVMDGGRILLDDRTECVFHAAEALARSALQPPQLTRLAQALQMPRFICAEEGFLHELRVDSL
ncbi:MAG: energy-coupling factor ABC transporter ATP-binding protein [Caldilinea sp.]|nr:energy-coupling factor ABC transporter ATP-binding protein [Caldilinea sp.]